MSRTDPTRRRAPAAIRAALCVVLAACAGTPGPARPPAGGGAQPPDAGAGAPGEELAGEAECDALIAHVIALGAADRARTAHGEPATTDADLAALRAELRAGPLFAECRTQPLARVRCALAAATTAALAACDGAHPGRASL